MRIRPPQLSYSRCTSQSVYNQIRNVTLIANCEWYTNRDGIHEYTMDVNMTHFMTLGRFVGNGIPRKSFRIHVKVCPQSIAVCSHALSTYGSTIPGFDHEGIQQLVNFKTVPLVLQPQPQPLNDDLRQMLGMPLSNPNNRATGPTQEEVQLSYHQYQRALGQRYQVIYGRG